MPVPKPVVCLIFRKKDPLFFSIEKVFLILIQPMQMVFDIRQKTVPHYSSSPKNIFSNINAVKKCRADVYHVTGDIHYAVLGLPRKKTVLTIHDCVFLLHTSGIKKAILKWFWLTTPVRRAAIITTISEKSKSEIIGHTGCRPEKIMVIPNAIGEYIYYEKKEFNEQRPVILFVGSTPNKNLLRVIAALKDIPAQLHIIGRVGEEARLLLQGNGIEYRQSAHLNEQELAVCYNDADLVLFPSTYEGFGLPILEGQKAGRPVVTSDLSPMKEVAGGAACLVDPYSIESIRSGVLKVIMDKAYRDELLEKGRRNVKHYEKEAIAEQYLACYRKLIK